MINILSRPRTLVILTEMKNVFNWLKRLLLWLFISVRELNKDDRGPNATNEYILAVTFGTASLIVMVCSPFLLLHPIAYPAWWMLGVGSFIVYILVGLIFYFSFSFAIKRPWYSDGPF